MNPSIYEPLLIARALKWTNILSGCLQILIWLTALALILHLEFKLRFPSFFRGVFDLFRTSHFIRQSRLILTVLHVNSIGITSLDHFGAACIHSCSYSPVLVVIPFWSCHFLHVLLLLDLSVSIKILVIKLYRFWIDDVDALWAGTRWRLIHSQFLLLCLDLFVNLHPKLYDRLRCAFYFAETVKKNLGSVEEVTAFQVRVLGLADDAAKAQVHHVSLLFEVAGVQAFAFGLREYYLIFGEAHATIFK